MFKSPLFSFYFLIKENIGFDIVYYINLDFIHCFPCVKYIFTHGIRKNAYTRKTMCKIKHIYVHFTHLLHNILL